jgi:hypothetical protein
MPRLGKIRLGVKATSAKGNEYPKDVDYFVSPPEVVAIYGETPKKLDVLFPCDDPTLFFPQALKLYSTARLLCKGNGKTATCIDPNTGEMYEKPCPCEHYTRTEPKPDCKAVGNLMVVLPQVSMGGCYQIDTSSTANIINLNSAITWIRGMLGRIAFVPLTLERVPTKIQTPEGQAIKALLALKFNGTMREAAQYRGTDAIGLLALPPAPEEADPETYTEVISGESEKNEAPGGKTTHEDAPQSTISQPPVSTPGGVTAGSASPGTPPPAGVIPAGDGAPLPAGKIRMIESMFRGKGVSGKGPIDKIVIGWYGVALNEVPAAAFDDLKARITAFPPGEGGPS